MKRLFMLSLATMALLMSCNPKTQNPDTKQEGSAELKFERYSGYTYNLDSQAINDPLAVEVFLNGSSEAASLEDLVGNNLSDGSISMHYFALEFHALDAEEGSNFFINGAVDGKSINANFDVGMVIDALSVFSQGGIPIQSKVPYPLYETTRVSGNVVLYRFDYDLQNGARYTKLNTGKSIGLRSISSPQILDAMVFHSPTGSITSDGSGEITFDVVNLTIDGNPIGRLHSALTSAEVKIFDAKGNIAKDSLFNVEVTPVLKDARLQSFAIRITSKGAPRDNYLFKVQLLHNFASFLDHRANGIILNHYFSVD